MPCAEQMVWCYFKLDANSRKNNKLIVRSKLLGNLSEKLLDLLHVADTLMGKYPTKVDSSRLGQSFHVASSLELIALDGKF